MLGEKMKNCQVGKNVMISPYSNVYGCTLGDDVFVGPFVEIQSNVVIGRNTRISSHSFVCSSVMIGEDCFIAHGVMFVNDLFTDSSSYRDLKDRQVPDRKTVIGNNVRIGSNCTILPVKIGDNAVIGAGSVVTKDVPAGSVVRGESAKIYINDK